MPECLSDFFRLRFASRSTWGGGRPTRPDDAPAGTVAPIKCDSEQEPCTDSSKWQTLPCVNFPVYGEWNHITHCAALTCQNALRTAQRHNYKLPKGFGKFRTSTTRQSCGVIAVATAQRCGVAAVWLAHNRIRVTFRRGQQRVCDSESSVHSELFQAIADLETVVRETTARTAGTEFPLPSRRSPPGLPDPACHVRTLLTHVDAHLFRGFIRRDVSVRARAPLGAELSPAGDHGVHGLGRGSSRARPGR